MTHIASYVFFDLETTGLPHLERNKTKITELCFVAVSRRSLEDKSINIKPTGKLTLIFNPQMKIQAKAAEITGLTNEVLKNAPTFKDNIDTILAFLNGLPKPVCLVAHNGDIFDYKIILAEFLDACKQLPADLLCVDSIKAFKSIFKNNINGLPSIQSQVVNDSLTEVDWTPLDISAEDWDSIDSLCSSFSEMPVSSSSPVRKKRHKQETISYKLVDLYQRLVNKKVENAHRAEDDCMMLLECVATVEEFIQWADSNCKNIHSIQPLDRNKYVNNK